MSSPAAGKRIAPAAPARILILCAQSWGALGNVTAARRLAKIVAHARDGVEVRVEAFEDWCPAIARAGLQMRRLTAESRTPEERNRRYLALIAELEAAFPDGFERMPEFRVAGCDLAAISARLDTVDPALVIGTKGLVSRIVQAAVGRARPVLNYVTNDGLLALALHRPPPQLPTVVTTVLGRMLLPGRDNVVCVGPLVGAAGRAVGPVDDPDPRPLVGILSNRGTDYGPIFDRLVALREAVRVRAIILGAPDLLAYVHHAAPDHWQVSDALTNADYLDALQGLGLAGSRLLICKAGPNTVFESVAAAVPMLALRSGLPMESWVADLIDEVGVGQSFASVAELVAALPGWIADRPRMARAADCCGAYADEMLDGAVNAARLSQALQTLCGI